MIRLNVVLLLAVLVSALYLVGVQYESRRLVTDIDKADSQARKLVAENERLQVEKRAQATPLRVERLAKKQLHMRTATPDITYYANYQGAPLAVTGSAEAAFAQRATGAAGRLP
jgi:cell division protein FtsL